MISLSLGEADFDTPDFIKAAANEAMEQNYTHYMPIPGFVMLGPQLQQNLKEITTLIIHQIKLSSALAPSRACSMCF